MFGEPLQRPVIYFIFMFRYNQHKDCLECRLPLLLIILGNIQFAYYHTMSMLPTESILYQVHVIHFFFFG